MTTKLDEIAPDIYRLSTFVPEVGPTGLTFNQFLIVDDDPLLFHTGHRPMFATMREAIERVMPIERLRWITFGHVESDECGSMNDLLAVAPRRQAADPVADRRRGIRLRAGLPRPRQHPARALQPPALGLGALHVLEPHWRWSLSTS